jgi:hypothetical protein
MVRLFVRHKVHDYAGWRKGYDAFEPTRIKRGDRAAHVSHRTVDGRVSPKQAVQQSA